MLAQGVRESLQQERNSKPHTGQTKNHPKDYMKFRLLLTIAGLVVGFGGPTRAQEKNAVDPQVRQEVEALNLKYDEAFNQNDAEAVAALFTADAVETGPEGDR
jgi:hypothetical protein